MRILTIQYKPIYLDVKSNLAKFERVIRRNAYLKPDLVIFPEYALTGPLYSYYNLAFSNENSAFSDLSTLANKYNINLIPGSFVRKVNRQKFNSTCFIDQKGHILGFYDKQILWSSEKKFLNEGTKTTSFNTGIGKIALQICADLHSPRISEEMCELKPDLIINLSMWSLEDKNACLKKVPDNIEFLSVKYLSKARALENKSYFVFCNYGGSLKIRAKTGRIYQETSIGNSMVINPYGQIVAKSSANGSETIFSEIDVSKCHWRR